MAWTVPFGNDRGKCRASIISCRCGTLMFPNFRKVGQARHFPLSFPKGNCARYAGKRRFPYGVDGLLLNDKLLRITKPWRSVHYPQNKGAAHRNICSFDMNPIFEVQRTGICIRIWSVRCASKLFRLLSTNITGATHLIVNELFYG